MTDESKNWINLYENMNQGKVDFKPDFYELDLSQDGGGDVKLVTPTQAQVDQAKMQLKRKLSVARSLFPKRRKKTSTKKKNQTGGKKKAKKSQRGGQKKVKRGKKPVKRKPKSKSRK